MIRGILQRHSILKGIVVVTPAAETTEAMVGRHMPALREAASLFDMGPLVREVDTSQWRRYGYRTRSLPLMKARRLGVAVFEDEEADDDPDDVDARLDRIDMTWEGPSGSLRISIRQVPDMLWNSMGPAGRRDSVGALTASVLRNAEALLRGEAVVSMDDGRDAIRFARINHMREVAIREGREDPYPGMGPVAEFRREAVVWAITADEQGITIAPVIVPGCPDPKDVIGMMKTISGMDNVNAAIERAKDGGRC